MSELQGVTIAAVERDTGLSKDTLRVWERRYGFPLPLRDPAGERLYPPDQVEKLRAIKRLMDAGLRPGKLMGTELAELNALLDARLAPAGAVDDLAPECRTILDLLRMHEGAALRTQLAQTLARLGLQRFVVDVIAPLNQRIGEAWLRGEIEVVEEHLYTEQVQNVLRAAIAACAAQGTRPRVLLTTLPDEEHALGLLMVEALLVPEGAMCISLGTRTPAADIRQAAVAGGFDIVALSFSSAYPARQAAEGLASLRAALPAHIAIWAGGAGVRERMRLPDGVRVIQGIADALTALREWLAQRAS